MATYPDSLITFANIVCPAAKRLALPWCSAYTVATDFANRPLRLELTDQFGKVQHVTKTTDATGVFTFTETDFTPGYLHPSAGQRLMRLYFENEQADPIVLDFREGPYHTALIGFTQYEPKSVTWRIND